jgi:FkbM family methyltransferase
MHPLSLLFAAASLACASANLERFHTTSHALPEEACAHAECVRAVRWAKQERLGDGCKHFFFDVGANIGLHGRFLYEPELFADHEYNRVFREAFLDEGQERKRDACVVAFEPNPAHREWLHRMATVYMANGFRYLVVFAAAGAGKSDSTLTFYRQDGGGNNDWGFSVKQSYGGPDTAKVEVPFVDFASFVGHHVGHRPEKGEQRVLMKMDIEGTEYRVIPHLLETGTSSLFDVITLEMHPHFCPVSFPAAGALPAVTIDQAACDRMGQEFPEQLAANGTTTWYIDVEFEGTLSPETHPLPKVISGCTVCK